MTDTEDSTRLVFNGRITNAKIHEELLALEMLLGFCGTRVGNIVADLPGEIPLETQGELHGIESALLMARDRASALDDALDVQGFF